MNILYSKKMIILELSVLCFMYRVSFIVVFTTVKICTFVYIKFIENLFAQIQILGRILEILRWLDKLSCNLHILQCLNVLYQ